jgi:hypothetical protein
LAGSRRALSNGSQGRNAIAIVMSSPVPELFQACFLKWMSAEAMVNQFGEIHGNETPTKTSMKLYSFPTTKKCRAIVQPLLAEYKMVNEF